MHCRPTLAIAAAALLAAHHAAAAPPTPFELSSPVVTPATTDLALASATASPPPPPTTKPTATRTPVTASPTARATAVAARGNAYRAPSASQGAAAAPSLSRLGYAQTELTLSGLDVAPCRAAEWLLVSGAGASLRFAVAKIANVSVGRVAIAAVDDGEMHLGDGSPALAAVNAAGVAPTVISREHCAPAAAGGASASPGASATPYARWADGAGDGPPPQQQLVVTLRLFGSGTAASVADASVALQDVDPATLAARFFAVSAQSAALQLDTEEGGGLLLVPPAPPRAASSGAAAAADEGRGGSVVLSPGALAGMLLGCVAGVCVVVGGVGLALYRVAATHAAPHAAPRTSGTAAAASRGVAAASGAPPHAGGHAPPPSEPRLAGAAGLGAALNHSSSKLKRFASVSSEGPADTTPHATPSAGASAVRRTPRSQCSDGSGGSRFTFMS